MKQVQPITASGRPKLRPLKWAEPPAPAPMPVHIKTASKAASELNTADESDVNDKPLQYKLPKPKLSQPKMKPSKPKSEVVKVKEALTVSLPTEMAYP